MIRGRLRGIAATCAATCAAALAALVPLSAAMLPRAALAQGPVGQLGNALPTLGDAGGLSLGVERRLGERIARELFRDPDYLDDPVLADYVQQLWQPLLAAARQRGDLPAEMDERFAWRVLLGRDRSINAFALPGGWLGLHLGLISATSSRDEVAAVLAHELSHVTQRHIARMIGEDSRQSPWLLGALILGAAVASRNPEAGRAVITGSQAVAARNQLNFSRDMEREADRVGFGVLTQAGFQPEGVVAMFERLEQASRLNDDGSLPYLRTHPLTSERIADMRARLPLQGQAEPQTRSRADLPHTLAAARARALSQAARVDGLRDLVREAEAVPADAPAARQAPALYAGTLAAHTLREGALAGRLLARLSKLALRDAAAERWVRLLGGELALASGDTRAALVAAGMRPTARPEVLMASQAQLRSGEPSAVAQAAERLQSWVTERPSDAVAWQLLAQAQAARGQPLRALRAEAEARVAVLDYQAALDRLRAAQALARQGGGDYIESSIIDTRARQLESLLREQAAER